MKKIITAVAVCGMYATVFAQGVVSINDTANFKITVNNGTSSANMGTVANTYIFDVLEWNVAGTPTAITGASSLTSANWIDTGVYGSNATGGSRSGSVLGATGSSTSAGFWGQTTASSAVGAYYVIVGWSATEAGQSWSTIVSAINGTTAWADSSSTGSFGWSIINGNGTGGVLNPATTGSAAGTALFASAANAVNAGFVLANSNVQAAPEPGTMALAALGGASLLLFRRRNK